MRPYVIFTSVVTAAALTTLSACGSLGRTAGAEPRYAWDFFNETPQKMEGVSVTYLRDGEQHSVPADSVMTVTADEPPLFRDQPPPYSVKRVLRGELPIPDRISVHWRDGDGNPHDQNVEVATAIPNAGSFSGVVWICLTKDKATMLARTDEQEKALGAQWNAAPADSMSGEHEASCYCLHRIGRQPG